MQDKQNKANEEKRLEAQMALEGEERGKAREEEKRKEELEKQKRIELKQKQKTQREEKKKYERQKKEKEDEIKKENIEKQKKEAVEREKNEKSAKAKKDAEKEVFLKKMRAPGKPPARIFKEEKIIQRISTKKRQGEGRKIPNIKTYKSAIAEAVKKQGESLAKIAIAEKKKTREKKLITKVKSAKAKENELTHSKPL